MNVNYAKYKKQKTDANGKVWCSSRVIYNQLRRQNENEEQELAAEQEIVA
jgi:hypothetical protein